MAASRRDKQRLAHYLPQTIYGNGSRPDHLESDAYSNDDQVFRSYESSPYLVKGQKNRILLYIGVFNPPHRGHMKLLTHVFEHGVSDLNVIAAISMLVYHLSSVATQYMTVRCCELKSSANFAHATVLPRSDSGIEEKRTNLSASKKTFGFTLSARCQLWKSDPDFPTWAFLYDKKKHELSPSYTECCSEIQSSALNDGFEIEYAMLCGPDCASTWGHPDPEYGAKLIILSDAARKAEYCTTYGPLLGRPENFDDCTEWELVQLDDKAKTDSALAMIRTLEEARQFRNSRALDPEIRTSLALLPKTLLCLTNPREADGLMYTGETVRQQFIEKTLVKILSRTMDKHIASVFECKSTTYRHLDLEVRFVTGERDGDAFGSVGGLSSTLVRDIMSKLTGNRLKAGLELLTLSPQLLWRYRTCWIDKAHAARNGEDTSLINLKDAEIEECTGIEVSEGNPLRKRSISL